MFHLSKRYIAFAAVAFLLCAVLAVLIADKIFVAESRIKDGIWIGHVYVGGLTIQEATERVSKIISQDPLPAVMLTDGKDIWPVNASNINFSVNVEKSVGLAYQVTREEFFTERWLQRYNLLSQRKIVPFLFDLDRNRLSEIVAKMTPLLNRSARDASILIVDKDVTILPAITGRKIISSKTAENAFSDPQPHLALMVNLIFDISNPKINDADFSGINTVISTFSSRFNPWDYERNANLRLAAESINGTVLKPGAVFSYNSIVGPRTASQGFRMAPVILDGKLVPDWGGGVCQVSSTLYNAALLANLEIVDRTAHGRAIGYVPLGFDATVVDGQIDFKFRNNLPNPVLIYSSLSFDRITFSLLGDKRDLPPLINLDYVVHKVIEPVEIKQQDPTLEAGKEVQEEPPQRGFVVTTYRIISKDGKDVRQKLFSDSYDPVDKIIKIGSKPIAVSSTTAPPAPSATAPLIPAQRGTITR